MNILVLGGGGREHAIAWALAKSPRTDSLYVAPGNGGTDGIAQNVPDLNPEDGQAVLAFVRENAIDFVVIGPEAPLVAGVADVLRAAGVPTFGPDAQGAQLEGSKAYSKTFMEENAIPTARYATFDALEPALAYVREQGAPIVVKADGLALGKGVTVEFTKVAVTPNKPGDQNKPGDTKPNKPSQNDNKNNDKNGASLSATGSSVIAIVAAMVVLLGAGAVVLRARSKTE